MLSQDDVTDLITNLHKTGGQYKQSNSFIVIRDYLHANKDAVHMIHGLVDCFIHWNEDCTLYLLMDIKESHTKTLLDRLLEHMKGDERTRGRVYHLFGSFVRRHSPWLSTSFLTRHFLHHYLKHVQMESSVVNLVSGILSLSALLPQAPLVMASCIGDLMAVLHHGAVVSTMSTTGQLSFVVKTHLHLALYSLFHRLYAMFPNNVLDFVRGLLKRKDNIYLFDTVLKDFFERVRFHPLLITTTKEGELSNTRWKTYRDSHEIVVDCARYSLDVIESSAADLGFTTASSLDHDPVEPSRSAEEERKESVGQETAVSTGVQTSSSLYPPRPTKSLVMPDNVATEPVKTHGHQLLIHDEVKEACKVFLLTNSTSSSSMLNTSTSVNPSISITSCLETTMSAGHPRTSTVVKKSGDNETTRKFLSTKDPKDIIKDDPAATGASSHGLVSFNLTSAPESTMSSQMLERRRRLTSLPPSNQFSPSQISVDVQDKGLEAKDESGCLGSSAPTIRGFMGRGWRGSGGQVAHALANMLSEKMTENSRTSEEDASLGSASIPLLEEPMVPDAASTGQAADTSEKADLSCSKTDSSFRPRSNSLPVYHNMQSGQTKGHFFRRPAAALSVKCENSRTTGDDNVMTSRQTGTVSIPSVLVSQGTSISPSLVPPQASASATPSYNRPLGSLQRSPLPYEMLFAAALPFSPLAVCPSCAHISYGVHLYSPASSDTPEGRTSLQDVHSMTYPGHLKATPAEMLENIMNLAKDATLSALVQPGPSTSTTSIEQELKSLRYTVRIQHVQILFERYRREQHAQRNRRLLSRLIRLRNAEVEAEDSSQFLMEKNRQIIVLRESLKRSEKKIQSLDEKVLRLQESLKMEARRFSAEKDQLAYTVTQLKLKLEERSKDIRALNKENEGLRNLVFSQDMEVLSQRQDVEQAKIVKQKLIESQKRLVMLGGIEEHYRSLLHNLYHLEMQSESRNAVLERYQEESRKLCIQQASTSAARSSVDSVQLKDVEEANKKLNDLLTEYKKKLLKIADHYHTEISTLKTRLRTSEVTCRHQQKTISDLELQRCQLEGKICRLERIPSLHVQQDKGTGVTPRSTPTEALPIAPTESSQLYSSVFVQTTPPVACDQLSSAATNDVLLESSCHHTREATNSQSESFPGQMFAFSPSTDVLLMSPQDIEETVTDQTEFVETSANATKNDRQTYNSMPTRLPSSAALQDLLQDCFPSSRSAPTYIWTAHLGRPHASTLPVSGSHNSKPISTVLLHQTTVE